MDLNVAFLQELLNTVAERGRALLPQSLFGGSSEEDIYALSSALLSGRGEASGVAIARAVLERYETLDEKERLAYFAFLARELNPDGEKVAAAARAYVAAANEVTLAELQAAAESPRQEFFRRLNLAPGATAAIVHLRQNVLQAIRAGHALHALDADLERLLQTWFNRGFLVLRRIDWQTPAAILEKIIRYEAVHAIESWEDLRRRLNPADRRCFAFFHPSLVDEPLIFVEVALTDTIPDAIAPLLAHEVIAPASAQPTTAVFYSISNCQPGLKGISFGNFLLKQVVEELARERPSLGTFVTLSPVPGFMRWLERLNAEERSEIATPEEWAAIEGFQSEHKALGGAEHVRPALQAMLAHYLLRAKGADSRPVDSVARFHLGNGARLERINWLADTSKKGWAQAVGFMVNYRYDLDDIERNHEAYAETGEIAASKTVRALLRPTPKLKDQSTKTTRLALPMSRSKRAPG